VFWLCVVDLFNVLVADNGDARLRVTLLAQPNTHTLLIVLFVQFDGQRYLTTRQVGL
jgi:hypothetical protein